MDVQTMMFVYSLLLALALFFSSPWWLVRMVAGGRYREGLRGRLALQSEALRVQASGRQVVWIHAVSVGEVLAIVRLVSTLQSALGTGWVFAVSTTTASGNRVAREKLAPLGCIVFWFPLDFASSVRRVLSALRPRLLLLVESELWPRLVWECSRASIPVAVVNARVSDRSFRRTLPVRPLWLRMAKHVTLWLAQGEETAGRLRKLGIAAGAVTQPGNLKYDAADNPVTMIAASIRARARGTRLVVAGSTLPGEETLLLAAWQTLRADGLACTLVLAPRHPQRFEDVAGLVRSRCLPFGRASEGTFAAWAPLSGEATGGILLLDTLGDLAGVYSAADLAFVGGSLVPRGGHNPLEPARFAVPVVMGPSFYNFREIVAAMQAADAICIVSAQALASTFRRLLAADGGMGLRGKHFAQAQSGATARTVAALLPLLGKPDA